MRSQVLLCALLMAACATRSRALGYLEGRVTAGPLRPVEPVETERTSKAPAVFVGRALTVAREDGIVAARAAIEPDGTYRAALPPGTYVVDLDRSGKFERSRLPMRVTINAGQTVRLDIEVDTGIR